MNLHRELEVAKELAISAGKSVLSFSPKTPLLRQYTRPKEMVIIPDLIADDIIVSGLRQAFPHDALCSEQTPVSSGRFECDRLWLIDALDGASDFVENGDQHAVSIGLTVCGKAVLGVVYNPARDELFAGTTAQPTTLNGRPVKPSMAAQLANASICIPKSERANFNSLPELHAARPIRSTSYQLARVAAGMDDGFCSLRQVREWCTCAGVALVAAAGGCATLHGALDINYNTSELTHPTGVIAAGCDLHRLLNRALTEVPNRPMRSRALEFLRIRQLRRVLAEVNAE